MEKELQNLKESPTVNIHIDSLRVTLKKIPNWKTQGLNGIHGFRFKKFTFIHDKLAIEMNKCLQERDIIPEWKKNTLIQKDHQKGTTANNCGRAYR